MIARQKYARKRPPCHIRLGREVYIPWYIDLPESRARIGCKARDILGAYNERESWLRSIPACSPSTSSPSPVSQLWFG